MWIRHGIAAFIVALGLGPAAAHEVKFGDLLIDHPWAKPSIGQAKTGAAFLRIVNSGKEPDRLVAASTPAAGKAELHTHQHDTGGVLRMRQVEAIEVPAGGTVALEPGGLHVMLFDVKKPLNAGFGFPLTLTFARAGTVEVTVAIEQQGATQQHHGK